MYPLSLLGSSGFPQPGTFIRSLLLDISSLSSRPRNVRMISSSCHAESKPEYFRQNLNGSDGNLYDSLLRLRLRDQKYAYCNRPSAVEVF